MINRKSKIIKFVEVAFDVAKSSLPAYSNKFSKHMYTQHQHTALLCIQQRFKLHYREVIEIVDEMRSVKEILGLNELPHFTALQKFFQRISSSVFESILRETIKLFRIRNPWVAIDSTGYSSHYASSYYAKKLEKQESARGSIT